MSTTPRRSLRLAGIPVHADLSSLFMAAFIALAFYSSHNHGGFAGVVAAVAAAVGLLVSLVCHEFGHALVARRQGVAVQRVTLWGLGGVAELGSEPSTPRAAALIAGAGPATSLTLAVLALGGTTVAVAAGAGGVAVSVAWWLGVINASLAVFNLLPGLPLDGGHLVAAWRWARTGERDRGYLTAARAGRTIGTLLIAGALLSALTGHGLLLWTLLVGFFIRSQAAAEVRRLKAALFTNRLQAAAEAIAHGFGRTRGFPGPGFGGPGFGGPGFGGGGFGSSSPASPRPREHVDVIDVHVVDDDTRTR